MHDQPLFTRKMKTRREALIDLLQTVEATAFIVCDKYQQRTTLAGIVLTDPAFFIERFDKLDHVAAVNEAWRTKHDLN